MQVGAGAMTNAAPSPDLRPTDTPADLVAKSAGDRLLDLRRGALVFAMIVKHGIFPFSGALPLLPWRRSSFAKRFRLCLEELGITYLKLGQFLALRFDILPAEVSLELNKLFEDVPTMPPEDARQIVERELGADIESLFAKFGEAPIAAGSVAQVHDAWLPSGHRVAVKVQRKGIVRIFRADIRNLRRLASLAQRSGVFGQIPITGTIDQFTRWTLREMDFRIEARTAERTRRDAGPAIVIPAIHWGLTTARVLTMDFIDGVSATNLSQIVAKCTPEQLRMRLPGFDLKTALHNFAEGSLSQLFVHGFFHGDPHPGNIFFLPENRVAFIDFGIFGALSAEQRKIVTGQIENLAVGNPAGSLRFYSLQVSVTEGTDFERFRLEGVDLFKRWYRALTDPNSPIEERHLTRYTGEMIEISRRNGLIFDLNYLLFWRALNSLNATLLRIQPQYDLLSHLQSFFARIRPSPMLQLVETLGRPGWLQTTLTTGLDTPRTVEHGLEALSRGASLRNLSVAWGLRRDRRTGWESAIGTLLLLAPSAAMLLASATLPGGLCATLLGLFATAAVLAVWRRR